MSGIFSMKLLLPWIAVVVTPVAMSIPTPTAPCCKLAFPWDSLVGSLSHNRNFIKNNNTDIRYALIAIRLKKLEQLQAFFEKSYIWRIGKRKRSVKNVSYVISQIIYGDNRTIGFYPSIISVFFLSINHNDSFSSKTSFTSPKIPAIVSR